MTTLTLTWIAGIGRSLISKLLLSTSEANNYLKMRKAKEKETNVVAEEERDVNVYQIFNARKLISMGKKFDEYKRRQLLGTFRGYPLSSSIDVEKGIDKLMLEIWSKMTTELEKILVFPAAYAYEDIGKWDTKSLCDFFNSNTFGMNSI